MYLGLRERFAPLFWKRSAYRTDKYNEVSNNYIYTPRLQYPLFLFRYGRVYKRGVYQSLYTSPLYTPLTQWVLKVSSYRYRSTRIQTFCTPVVVYLLRLNQSVGGFFSADPNPRWPVFPSFLTYSLPNFTPYRWHMGNQVKVIYTPNLSGLPAQIQLGRSRLFQCRP